MQDNVLYIYLLIKFFLLASADDVYIIFILQKRNRSKEFKELAQIVHVRATGFLFLTSIDAYF